MSTWYEVGRTSTRILIVEATRETKSSIWICGNRRSKESAWSMFFPTWDEAHAYLTARAEENLQDARINLQRAQGEYGNVKSMKEPKE